MIEQSSRIIILDEDQASSVNIKSLTEVKYNKNKRDKA